MDDVYNFSGYVEFHNDSDENISLSSYTLTHYDLKKTGEYAQKWSWRIDKEFTVEANSYKLMWFDGTNFAGHAPYKLDHNGGYLNLYNPSNTLADSLSYGEMHIYYSYGRYDGAEGYMSPSPSAPNTKAYPELSKSTRCTKPATSKEPGVANEPFDLELTSSPSDAEIYYTLDGSEPSLTNGSKYEAPIHVVNNTVVRARAYSKELMPSKVLTASYIFMDSRHQDCGGFQVPIVAITSDPKYFFDNMVGILVDGSNGTIGAKDCLFSISNFNQDWKRPVSFEYIVDGKCVVSQELEAAVEGGCSRNEEIKSLSLKASSKTGDKDIDYHFFKSKPDIKHQTLHLRNGGTAYDNVRFRDGLMQTFASTMNIDYQAYQPVAFYLNGTYKCLMNLNERTNADYIKANYGIDEENIDLITISDQLGINASRGDLNAYNELVNYLSSTDPKSETFYEGASKLMDLDEYIDYQVFQQFIGNTDWPGNNTKIWRERKEGGKFRWILFDTDFGFGMPGYYTSSTVSTNMFTWCLGQEFIGWANNQYWMINIFSSLSRNTQFRRTFINKYKEHLKTTFSHENIETVFDSITTIVDAEYCATFSRSAVTDAEPMRSFALNRGSNLDWQFQQYLTDTGDVDEYVSEGLTFLYYIPQESKVTVLAEHDIVSVEVYDTSGKLISKEAVGDTYYEHDMSSYDKGIYVFNIRFKKGTIAKKVLTSGRF